MINRRSRERKNVVADSMALMQAWIVVECVAWSQRVLLDDSKPVIDLMDGIYDILEQNYGASCPRAMTRMAMHIGTTGG